MLFFIYPAFAAKVCIHYVKPDTILLRRKADVYYSRNPPCNAEDNLSTKYIIIEDWFRGYCGSPGLGCPRASGLLDVSRTDGPSRYKTEDYLLCPVGTPVCVDGKYRCPDMLVLCVKPTLYNPKPLRCLYKPEGRSEAGSQHC